MSDGGLKGEIEELLRRGGISSARTEARWIVSAARDLDDARRRARRRLGGEPLQYVTGIAGFRRLELEVGPGVLIPRPETEVVVDHVLARLPPDGTVVDVGTGSGAIALAVRDERPDAFVVATELDADAIEWARRNARRLGLALPLVRCDLVDALVTRPWADVVVANPPYVAPGDTLPREIVDHEPHVALFGGAHGLALIESVAAAARPRLRGGGHLVLEIGDTQGFAAAELVAAAGYRDVEVHPDLTGRDRVITATWH